jgi:hypothetical protein
MIRPLKNLYHRIFHPRRKKLELLFSETFGKRYTLEINNKTSPDVYVQERVNFSNQYLSTVVVPMDHNSLYFDRTWFKPTKDGKTVQKREPTQDIVLNNALAIKKDTDAVMKNSLDSLESTVNSILKTKVKDNTVMLPGKLVTLSDFYTERMLKYDVIEDEVLKTLFDARKNDCLRFDPNDKLPNVPKLIITDDRIRYMADKMTRHMTKGFAKRLARDSERAYETLIRRVSVVNPSLGRDLADGLDAGSLRSSYDERLLAGLDIVINNDQPGQTTAANYVPQKRNVETFEDLTAYHQRLLKMATRYSSKKQSLFEKTQDYCKFSIRKAGQPDAVSHLNSLLTILPGKTLTARKPLAYIRKQAKKAYESAYKKIINSPKIKDRKYDLNEQANDLASLAYKGASAPDELNLFGAWYRAHGLVDQVKRAA